MTAAPPRKLPDTPSPGAAGYTASQLAGWIMGGAPPPRGHIAEFYFTVALQRLHEDHAQRRIEARQQPPAEPPPVSLYSHVVLLRRAPADWLAGLAHAVELQHQRLRGAAA